MDRVPEGSVKYILKANKDRMKRNSSKRIWEEREREREDVGEVSKSNSDVAGRLRRRWKAMIRGFPTHSQRL